MFDPKVEQLQVLKKKKENFSFACSVVFFVRIESQHCRGCVVVAAEVGRGISALCDVIVTIVAMPLTAHPLICTRFDAFGT